LKKNYINQEFKRFVYFLTTFLSTLFF
jgi:hypothetical protein